MSRWRARIRGINPVPTLTISGAPPASARVGEPYDFTPVAEGGLPPLTFSLVGDLPDGLTFDPETGAITGTPT